MHIAYIKIQVLRKLEKIGPVFFVLALVAHNKYKCEDVYLNPFFYSGDLKTYICVECTTLIVFTVGKKKVIMWYDSALVGSLNIVIFPH